MPFALWPQFITHIGILRAKSTGSQALLMLTLLLYFAWFVYVYVDAFYIHLDPQSAIAILFPGFYASPVLLMLWLLAYWVEARSKMVRFTHPTAATLTGGDSDDR